VVVDGRTFRYLILGERPAGQGATVQPSPRGTAEPLVDAALVDLGGPGRALFGNDDAASVAARWPGSEVLLFLEEPWVTRQLSDGCARSLRELHAGVRAEQEPSGRGLVAACELGTPGTWGWSADDYRAVVDAVVRKERLRLRGVVGSSYGAPRTAAVTGRDELEWLVLNSPSPAEATGARYLQARTAAVLDALAAACAGCAAAEDAASVVATAQGRLRAAPVVLPERTPPVVAADAAAAAVAAAYLPDAERAALVEALRTPTTQGAALVGRLSDSTLLRYGELDVSPALLAYYDEVCRSYAPWDGLSSVAGPVGALLSRLHAPCAAVARVGGAPPPAPAQLRSCVATSERDAVTPPAFARTWTDVLDEPVTLTVPGTVHAGLEGLTSCLRRVADGAAPG